MSASLRRPSTASSAAGSATCCATTTKDPRHHGQHDRADARVLATFPRRGRPLRPVIAGSIGRRRTPHCPPDHVILSLSDLRQTVISSRKGYQTCMPNGIHSAGQANALHLARLQKGRVRCPAPRNGEFEQRSHDLLFSVDALLCGRIDHAEARQRGPAHKRRARPHLCPALIRAGAASARARFFGTREE